MWKSENHLLQFNSPWWVLSLACFSHGYSWAFGTSQPLKIINIGTGVSLSGLESFLCGDSSFTLGKMRPVVGFRRPTTRFSSPPRHPQAPFISFSFHCPYRSPTFHILVSSGAYSAFLELYLLAIVGVPSYCYCSLDLESLFYATSFPSFSI